MNKRTGCIAVAMLLLLSVLTGCAKDNKTTLTGTDTVVIARVTAVKGSKLTVSTASFPGMPGEGGDMQFDPSDMSFGEGDMQVTPPDMPDGDDIIQGGSIAEDSMQGDIPAIPGGAMPGDIPAMPGGAMQGDPANMPEGGSFDFTGSGESGSITLKDTSVLFKLDTAGETSATLSDISEGSVLMITFDASGKISKIVIASEDFMMGGDFGGQIFDPNGENFDPNAQGGVITMGEDITING